MFCSNCGHKLSEGQKFCPSCGESASGAADEAKTAPSEVKPEPETVADNSIYKPASPSAVNGSPYYQPSFEPAPAQPKKKKKGLKALIIILVALAVFAALVVGMIFLFKGFMKTPVQEMQELEKSNFRRGISEIEEVTEAASRQDKKYAYTVTAEPGEALKAVLGNALDMSWLKTVSLNLTADGGDGKAGMLTKILINGKQILSLAAKPAGSDGSMLLYSPELCAGKAMDSGADLPKSVSPDMLWDMTDRLTALSKKYYDMAVSHLTDVTRESGTYSANGIEASCTLLSATVPGKEAHEIVIELLNTAKDDPEIKKIFDDISVPLEEFISQFEYGGSEQPDVYGTFRDRIDEAVASVRESMEQLNGSESITITDYVVANRILGRKLTVKDSDGNTRELIAAIAKKDGTFGAEFSIDGEPAILAVGTYSGNIYTGTLSLMEKGNDMVTVEFQDLDKENKTGKAKISFSESMWKDYSPGSYNPLMKTIRLELEFSKDSCTADVTLSGASMIKITLASAVPEDIPDIPETDAVDPDEYLDSVSIDAVKKNLQDAGVPQIIISAIEMALSSGIR